MVGEEVVAGCALNAPSPPSSVPRAVQVLAKKADLWDEGIEKLFKEPPFHVCLLVRCFAPALRESEPYSGTFSVEALKNFSRRTLGLAEYGNANVGSTSEPGARSNPTVLLRLCVRTLQLLWLSRTTAGINRQSSPRIPSLATVSFGRRGRLEHERSRCESNLRHSIRKLTSTEKLHSAAATAC